MTQIMKPYLWQTGLSHGPFGSDRDAAIS